MAGVTGDHINEASCHLPVDDDSPNFKSYGSGINFFDSSNWQAKLTHCIKMGKVEDFNGLNTNALNAKYLRPDKECPQLDFAISKQSVGNISCYLPAELGSDNFKACFELIESTSRDNYKTSSVGWSPAKKKKEMLLPDMRYLLFYNGKEMQGFLSFMVTYEDGYEVIYCYELHLQPYLRGKGVGRRLMEIMEFIGRKVELEKAMLTVFLDNTGGLQFYNKLGYSEDDFSPEPRILRDGTVKKSSYIILSRSLK